MSTMNAIEIHEFGGANVLAVREIPKPSADSSHVLVKVEAAGVNFIDVYQRTGLYKNPLPFVPGMEGAGTVEAIGESVEGFAPGDRVAWCMTTGAYAEYAKVPTRVLVKVPDAISLDIAAAALLQGLTAHYLVRSSFELKAGHTALIHAAAGGVGLLLVQMAKALGAFVIATTSTEEKAALVREAGADHTILYSSQDFLEATRTLTGGTGVDVVYDSVGASTFTRSLRCLKPRGMMVTFGQSSGPIEPFSPLRLAEYGSLFLTRPNLAHYLRDRQETDWRAGELFASIEQGKLHVRVDSTYALSEAGKAQTALESRGTAGKLLIHPGRI
ncbi:MAG: quinone oxidoreductase [Bryobacterales bacterium]|nr:quinone oxidoreductase [Bryobacterales bacterium]